MKLEKYLHLHAYNSMPKTATASYTFKCSHKTNKQKNRRIFDEDILKKLKLGFRKIKKERLFCYSKSILVLDLTHPFRHTENELHCTSPLNNTSITSRLPETLMETNWKGQCLAGTHLYTLSAGSAFWSRVQAPK